jgi:hypothetical protein
MERLKIGQLLELERLRLGRRNLRICSDPSRLIFQAMGVGCGVKSICLNSEIYGNFWFPGWQLKSKIVTFKPISIYKICCLHLVSPGRTTTINYLFPKLFICKSFKYTKHSFWIYTTSKTCNYYHDFQQTSRQKISLSTIVKDSKNDCRNFSFFFSSRAKVGNYYFRLCPSVCPLNSLD